jgi:glycosyltransferase involved in cell wall biosynthesis
MVLVVMVAGTYRPERDGVAHYVRRLRSALEKRGVSSVVLTTKEAALASRDKGVRGVVDGWGPTDLPSLLRSIVEAVRETEASLIHIQHAAGTYGFKRAVFFLPPLLRAARVRAPLVTTVHEYAWWEWEPRFVPKKPLEALKTYGQRRGLWDREDGFLLTGSDAVIATNTPAENAIAGRLPQLADRLYRVPLVTNVDVTTVDRDEPRNEVRLRFGWPPDVEVVVYFGFLHPVKGIEYLLEAFREVIRKRPLARLLIVGGAESLALGEESGWYWNKLQRLASHLGLADSTAMTGYVPDGEASRLLSGADVGVLPFNQGVTLKSGALLTLLTHGLPVVATRSDPPEPDLAGGRILRLIERRDTSVLADTLVGLLSDSSERARLGEAGRGYVETLSWPSVAERHIEVYEAVLHRRVKHS